MVHHWAESSSNVFGLSDIAGGVIAPPPPLFKDFILDNTLTMISSPPHEGKSLLVAAMVVALDTSLPLFGKYHPNGVKRTLAMLQDAPTWDYATQFRKIIRGYGITREQGELLESTLVINRGITVTDPKFIDHLKLAHAENEFDVLVLDAFWTIHGMNINDQSHMAMTMNRLKQVRDQFGIAVIFTHHERKPTEVAANKNYMAAGSFVISAAVDFHLNLLKRGRRVKLELPKGRGADETVVEYDVVDVEHPQGAAIKLQAVDEGLTRRGVLLTFLSEPRKRAELIQLVSATEKVTTARAAKILDNELTGLHARGKVERVGFGIWKAT